jgi:NADH-quinone oxidoreductase subunit G
MIKFMLDGKEAEVVPGATILTAARAASIDIPTFCYQDRLSIPASCRMCLIEIEGRQKLEPACSTKVADDMVIHTRSEKVVAAREDMLEILLANHPLDCPICDKAGECELQDTVYDYGKGDSRFHDTKRVFRTRDIELNDVIVFNADRCIQCQRCVRVCEEIVGDVALGTAERGLDSEITGVGNSLKDCSHCGNCIEVCPVGALMSTPYRYKARPWDMVQTDTICSMCGTGCSMTIETRDGELMRVKSKYETGINGELLCAKGRFGFDIIDGGARIREPMIRKAGTLTPVNWDEAIGFIANTAKNIRHSGGHIQGLISPRQTNETAYMFQKLMRTVFKSDAIHSSCRFGGLGTRGRDTLEALAQVMARRYSREPLQSVLNADCIVLLGANITEENPVTGYLIRATLRDRNNQLLIASSRPCGLDDIAVATLRLLPGFEARLLSVLTTDDQQPGNDDIAGFVASAKAVIAAAKSVTLLVGTEFLRSSAATNCLAWIEKAARLLEADGRQVFVQFLFDRPNQLGLWDMGCLPGISPGWQDGDEPVVPADAVPDLFYVLGADPVSNCPGGDPREAAAMKTTCLVVQDSHMSKTAEMATVVLPAPSYGEETGTYTNNEGRVQKLRAIKSPTTGVMSTIEVFNLIAASMELHLAPDGIEQVFSEITAEVPGYQDLDKCAVENDFGLTTPLPSVDETVIAPALVSGPACDPEKGYSLITGDSLFHSGLLSARSQILSSLGDGPYVEMNPGDGFDKDMEGYCVTVTRNGAAVTARLKVNKAFAEGLVYVPENLLSVQTAKLLFSLDYPCAVDVNIFFE